jgi:hypothetical protein
MMPALPSWSAVVTALACTAAATFGALAWLTQRGARLESDARVAALTSTLQAERPVEWAAQSPTHAGDPSLVARESAHEAHTHVVALTGLAVVSGVAILVGFTMWSTPQNRGHHGPVQQLELTDMSQSQDASALAVAGRVRLPPGASAHALSVEVVAFDGNGHAVASGGGLLKASDETQSHDASFSVSVPHASHVARYAVRFRDGSFLVKHIDRRPTQPSSATASRPEVAP